MKSIVPFPHPPKRTTTRPRTRASRWAKRPKEAKGTRLEPMRAGLTLSKAYRLLLKSWAWGACQHGKRLSACSKHAAERADGSFLTPFSVPADWMASNMKMEGFLLCRRRAAVNLNSTRKKGVLMNYLWFLVRFYLKTSVDIICVSVCSSYLCDVTLKSEDGKEFPCHKSVLCARLGRIHKKAFFIHIINVTIISVFF